MHNNTDVNIIDYTLSRELDKIKRKRRSAERDLADIKSRYELASVEVEYYNHCEKEILEKLDSKYIKKMSEPEFERVRRAKYNSSVKYRRNGITEESI